ncbi:MAG: type II toxin-antitoxin system HicB family antitoxin [bacterium]|nr:type II toxin-antitoxin system HicB family antitoxin [bacterium]
MAKQAKNLQFKVLVERDEDGIYVASVPELPGCYTQGKTLDEVRKRIKKVIELVLESDKDIRKEKLTSPRSPISFLGIEDLTIRSYA